MAKAFIMDFAGVTAEQYDAVTEELHLDGHAPQGCMWHYAGPGPDGWRVTDVWSDPAAFERFAKERLGPITAGHGLPEPRVQALDVAVLHVGTPRRAQIVQLVMMPGLDEATFLATHHRAVPDDHWPEHVVHHVNGPMEGGWYVLDSWDDRGARDEFIETRVKPNLPPDALTGEPRIEEFPVHDMLVERAATPA